MSALNYQSFLRFTDAPDLIPDVPAGPDDRSGAVYLSGPALKLAAEIAIVTSRPLLIRGEPGCGKSSFAAYVARNLGWRYYEFTVTGRTEARDLLWHFDALARLRDANVRDGGRDLNPNRYLTAGPLWWAFNRSTALELVRKRSEEGSYKDEELEPFGVLNAKRDPTRAVVLIDEVDKADPNVPNDLLEVIGLNRFVIEETGEPVKREVPAPGMDPELPGHYGSLLIIITTNDERDLPAAFVRRCVVHTIQEPKDEAEQIERLRKIGEMHLARQMKGREIAPEVLKLVASACVKLRSDARKQGRRGPSAAEFLDAMQACIRLKISPKDSVWEEVQRVVLTKE